MRVGMIGAGKLGLPVALAIESCGHDVRVYDVNPHVEEYLQSKRIPYVEEGIQPLLDETKVDVAQSVGELVEWAEVVFVAVQTPHDPKYEGATRIPKDRKDFDYTHLKGAISQIAAACWAKKEKTIVAVISTCLPGTFEREIKPLLNARVQYVYTPQFIAMGTVLNDYWNPEFNLIGVHDEDAAEKLQELYKTVNNAPDVVTDITTAEAIKVSYNTFITMKTVLANTWGELCQKVGANVDDVFKAWSMSHKRLLSPKYLRAGMGDGGGCHPRDNIALSYVAEQVGLSHNIFEDLMQAREDHAEWLAKEAELLTKSARIPLVLLGRSFKPETNIETGSPALLVASILDEHKIDFKHAEDVPFHEMEQAVYLLTTAHKRYKDYGYPKGSIVLDPFRMVPDTQGVTVIRLGE